MTISLKNIRKKYGDRMVLEVKDIDFEENSVYTILGPNGSGKS